ncbi:ribonuclease R [soil metagenome]
MSDQTGPDAKRVIDAIVKSKSPVSVQELTRQFRIKGNERRDFRALLKELERTGKIAKVSGKNYTAPSGKSDAIIGTLQIAKKGFGFVRPDWGSLKGKPPFEGDLFISPRDMGGAMDGDTVRAELTGRGREGVSGRVQEVIERARTPIVGWYQATNAREGEVHPRDSRLGRRVIVPRPPQELNIKDFEWVKVEIVEFTSGQEPLLGRVTERLGSDEDRGIDVLLVLRDRGIEEEFPPSVEKEAEDLRFDWANDLKGRTDYRKLPTCTIDPKTAKDFDDALSIEKHPDGGWTLYVHIADVAHFVVPGTALDREALERSTSVYPVDRVVPMLPQKISNYLCSLIPHEDRLAVTAAMHINLKGQIVSAEFHSSAIYSDFRFNYEQVQEFFNADDKGDVTAPELEPFKELFSQLREVRKVARILRDARFKRGALDLDIPQATVIFDDAGKVSDLKFYPRYESHQLVEECMLIANEAVAQHLTEKGAPLLYRIHEVADEQRLEKLEPVLKAFGIRLGGAKGKITPQDIQKALAKAQELEAGHIIRRLILRAMKRAEYSPVNEGHFGLASDNYCHFTSPIRRYPDVIVHRQLKALETGSPLPYPVDDNDLDYLGDHTSQRERRAQEAEWEAIAIKSMEFMKRYEGDEFDAYIASVQNFGLFVELKQYPVEGFIQKRSLPHDVYDMDDNGLMLIGRNTGRKYKLADKIRVRIDKVDPFAREMNLSIVDEDEAPRGKRTLKKSSPRQYGEKKKTSKRRGRR